MSVGWRDGRLVRPFPAERAAEDVDKGNNAQRPDTTTPRSGAPTDRPRRDRGRAAGGRPATLAVIAD